MKEFVKFIDALYEWMKKKVNQAQHRILNYAQVEAALWKEVMFQPFDNNLMQTKKKKYDQI